MAPNIFATGAKKYAPKQHSFLQKKKQIWQRKETGITKHEPKFWHCSESKDSKFIRFQEIRSYVWVAGKDARGITGLSSPPQDLKEQLRTSTEIFLFAHLQTETTPPDARKRPAEIRALLAHFFSFILTNI